MVLKESYEGKGYSSDNAYKEPSSFFCFSNKEINILLGTRLLLFNKK